MTVAAVQRNEPTQPSQDIIERVRAEMEKSGLSQAEVSRQADVSKTRLSQYLNGHYPGDAEAVGEALEKWLAALNARTDTSSQMPSAPAFQMTATARRIWSGLSYAQMAGDITVVYGGAGAGKTATAQEYRRENPNVWIVTMSPDCKSCATALEEICDQLGFREIPSGAARMRRAIERRIRDTQGLLIIDESQPLGTEALDAIRSLHDRTGIGLVLMGNETVYARMTGGNRAAYLDRLFSRIGKRVSINRPTKADTATIIDAWGVKAEDARKLLADLATGAGGLRRLTKVMRMASMMAGASGRTLNVDMIRAAVKDLEDAGGV